SSQGKYAIHVTNQSSQDLKNGAFHLFYDDSDGIRTEIITPDFTNGYSASLATNASFDAAFTPPSSGTVSNYFLVFQGTIGTASGSAQDSVDDGRAVIAAKFPPFFRIASYDSNCFASLQPGSGTGCPPSNYPEWDGVW